MFCITLDSNDPYFNLAIEEILLKNRKEDYIILGINSPSVIIGKHQSPHREINTRFISEKNIPVIRRITGGGTVFHDLGNLNFTFIMQSESGKQIDFRKYTKPVIDFLESHGVTANFEGKNDLKVNGLKISGNAEHVYRNRVLHHGTLLFNTTLEMLRNTLRKDTSCYTSRAVESNPSKVTNLAENLPGFNNISEFRDGMMEYFLNIFPDATLYHLSESETEEAHALAESKYHTWEWNWAYGPEYHFDKHFDYCGDKVSCQLYVKEGTIRECILEGSTELSALSGKFVGRRHMVEDIKEVFKEEKIVISDKDIFNLF